MGKTERKNNQMVLNIQTLLKKSINLSASLGLLTISLLPSLTVIQNMPVIAETKPMTLDPGETIDKSQDNWTTPEFTMPHNYTPVGKNTVGAKWIDNTTYNFGTFQRNTGSWLPLNGAVDMRYPIRITGTTFANAGGANPGAHLGDANGILLTNLPAAKLSQGATANALGIGNLGPNTYFIGNNYAFKQTWWQGAYKSATVIARGDGAKAKTLNASPIYDASNNTKNPFIMEWKTPVLNSDGTITGEMSYTTQNNGTPYTASTTITVQKSMSIGFMAATGGNYAKMAVTISSAKAGKGKQPAYINYLNTATGQQFAPSHKKWQFSTVVANIGDILRVVASNDTPGATTYIAPTAPLGYKLSSISPAITISNFPEGTTNPNQINVSYSPLPQTSTITYQWASNVPGQNGIPGKLQASLPSSTRLSGYTDSQLQFSPTIPKGYAIDTVRGPDSKIYTDTTIAGLSALEAAQNANPTFKAGDNHFLITLKALKQDVTLSFIINHYTTEKTPDNPGVQLISQALTGAMIDESDIKKMQDWLNNWITTKAIGWGVQDYETPSGSKYQQSLKQAIAGAGGHTLVEKNQYQVTLAYNGSLTFSDIPSVIDFGSHPISPKNKSYTGKLNRSLKVADTRGKNSLSRWQVTVRESTPIRELRPNKKAESTTSPQLRKDISFANHLTFNGKVLNNDDMLIHATSQPKTGETTLIDKDKLSPLILSVPIEYQKSLALFRGKITWTLLSAP